MILWDSLLSAALDGDCESVRNRLDHGGDINTTNQERQTALHLAAKNDQRDVVRLLISRNADLNASDRNDNTALMLAAKNQRKEVVRLLLDANADAEVSDQKNGCTPLHVAAKNGNRDVVRLLISQKADLNASDKEGNTALMLAAKNHMKEVVRLLLDANADTEISGEGNRYTPLHIAAKGGDRAIVQLLLDKAAGRNARDNDDYTPYELAMKGGFQNVMKLLQDKNEDEDRDIAALDDEENPQNTSPQHNPGEQPQEDVPVGQLGPWKKPGELQFTMHSMKPFDPSNVIAFSSDGKLIAMGGRTGEVTLWAADTATFSGSTEGNLGSITALAFSPDSTRLAVGSFGQSDGHGGGRFEVSFWTCGNPPLLLNTRYYCRKLQATALSFSPTKDLVAISFTELDKGSPQSQGVIKFATVAPTRFSKSCDPIEHQSMFAAAVFSPDGESLAFASTCTQISLYNIKDRSTIKTFTGPWNGIRNLAFSPDGARLAGAADDGTVWLWDTVKGQLLWTKETPESEIFKVVFSPCGEFVAAICGSRSIQTWAAATGILLKVLQGCTERITGIAFQSNGQLNATEDCSLILSNWAV